MDLEDDRTDAQRRTHTVLVVGTDTFMSGWGKATGGTSYAAWACEPSDMQAVWRWVKGREEMKNVRLVRTTWRPKGVGHAHIYVVDREKNHPSLAGDAS